MEPAPLFNLLARLERDLAGFYADLGRLKHLAALQPVFTFMEQHSSAHAEQIAGQARFPLPEPPRLEPIQELHHRVKRALGRQLAEMGDPLAVADRLVEAEGIVGQIYQGLGAHYQRSAEAYRRLAGVFETLAREERQHGEAVVQAKERLAAPPPQAPAAG
jgi:hypothetical protein